MSPSDLHLLLEQTSLAERAQEIAGIRVSPGRESAARLVRAEIERLDLWSGEIDASILGHYVRGELDAGQVEEHFGVRLQSACAR